MANGKRHRIMIKRLWRVVRQQEGGTTYVPVAVLQRRADLLELGGNWAGAGEIYAGNAEAARLCGDQALYAVNLLESGEVMRKTGDPRRAIERFGQSLEIMLALGDYENCGRCHNDLGLAYSDLGDNDRYRTHLDQALDMFQRAGHEKGVGVVYGNLGGLHLDLGEYTAAQDYYNRQMKIACAIVDLHGLSSATGGVGNVYFMQGAFREAERQYHEALRIARQAGNAGVECVSLYNLGDVYFKLGERGAAMDHYRRSRNISFRLGDRYGLILCDQAMAEIDAAEGNIEHALERLRDALQQCRDCDNSREAEAVLNKMTELKGLRDRVPQGNSGPDA
ncbi:MAG: tetratricopeptide repeat protein [Candidatus Edwardsbacteria bacterium]|nr:tetratricopeptide repeat protein [Candidatus Edwardsbacteria bacterium]